DAHLVLQLGAPACLAEEEDASSDGRTHRLPIHTRGHAQPRHVGGRSDAVTDRGVNGPSTNFRLLTLDFRLVTAYIAWAMRYLTERQRDILNFIRDFQKERGIAPTHREICDHFGFSSYGTVYKHLSLLEKKGLI